MATSTSLVPKTTGERQVVLSGENRIEGNESYHGERNAASVISRQKPAELEMETRYIHLIIHCSNLFPFKLLD